MIDFCGRPGGLIESRLAGHLQQGSATGWTPVRDGFLSKNGVTMAANAFHTSKAYRIGLLCETGIHYSTFTLDICILAFA